MKPGEIRCATCGAPSVSRSGLVLAAPVACPPAHVLPGVLRQDPGQPSETALHTGESALLHLVVPLVPAPHGLRLVAHPRPTPSLPASSSTLVAVGILGGNMTWQLALHVRARLRIESRLG
jgi:hypothetical protein